MPNYNPLQSAKRVSQVSHGLAFNKAHLLSLKDGKLYVISSISHEKCSELLQSSSSLFWSLNLSLYLFVFIHSHIHIHSYFIDQYKNSADVHPRPSLCYTQPPLAQDHWVGALLKKLSFPSRDSVISVVKEPSGSSQGAEVVSSAGEEVHLTRGHSTKTNTGPDRKGTTRPCWDTVSIHGLVKSEKL